jgi:hypothetical protein
VQGADVRHNVHQEESQSADSVQPSSRASGL